MMTKLEAIEKRISRRNYQSKSIETDILQKLKASINSYNIESGLSIQFIENGAEVFKGFRKSYGLFHGVRSFIALVGKTLDNDLMEKAGYYGELLVLEATTYGLGTCFVVASYDKKNCPCEVDSDEALIGVITIGPVDDSRGFKEKLVYRMAHRGNIKADQLYNSDQEVPSWFMQGIRAVQIAPSALNIHPVRLSYVSGQVKAYVDKIDGYNLVELGIAKANFEIAAGGNFERGNHGIFNKGL